MVCTRDLLKPLLTVRYPNVILKINEILIIRQLHTPIKNAASFQPAQVLVFVEGSNRPV